MLTTLPLIGSLLAMATATLSYGMSRKAHALAARSASQQEARGRSEETMRLLRWAVELATEPSGRRSLAGIAVLRALKNDHATVRIDRAFVHAVSAATMAAAQQSADYADHDEFRAGEAAEGGDDA